MLPGPGFELEQVEVGAEAWPLYPYSVGLLTVKTKNKNHKVELIYHIFG